MIITGKRIIQKVLAILVVLTMTMAEFTMVGVNLISYAVDQVKINNENVGFNVYFEDGNNALETTSTIDKNDLKVAIELNVKKDGYLSNGKIVLDEGSNFKFKADTKNSYISKVEDRAIYLKQINEGDNVKIEAGIEFVNLDELDIDYLNRTSTISLSGTYVNSNNVKKAKNIDINGEAALKVNWKPSEQTQAVLNAKLLTNSMYKVEDANKRIVQLLVTSNLENNSYPVRNTNIELNIPGEPEDVDVHARSTNATNGDRGFSEENFTYSDGKLSINVENGQDNRISWEKSANDTFIVTLTYGEDAKILNSKIAVNSKVSTYDEAELARALEVAVNEDVDGIVTGEEIETPSQIEKGNLYIGKEKDYSTVTRLHIDYSKAVEEIVLEEQKPTFLSQNEQKVANIEYTSTVLNKDQFISLFGEDGVIYVEDQNGNTVATISKDSETTENGSIIVNYEKGTTKLKFNMSKPQTEGTLSMRNSKRILKTSYSREELNEISRIKDGSKITYTKNNNEENTNNAVTVMNLKETESKVNFTAEPVTLSTAQKEQELHLTAVLESDSEAKDLYKNPVIKITLPKQINNVKAQARLLYGNGLNLTAENFKVGKENGKQVILVKLTGEQKSYLGEAVKGTTLLINAKVGLDRLATNSAEEVVLNYNNENAVVYADKAQEKAQVNIVSENSMILTNDIDEYKVSSTDNEGEKEVSLDINAKAQEAKVKMQIVNNEEADISNIAVVGKIANLNGKIERTSKVKTNAENAKVYYTTVEEPTKDLSDSKNGWTTENIKDAKNYLVSVENVKDAQSLNVSYDIAIAENLKYNMSAETGYNVTYTNSLTGTEKQAESTNLVLTTGNAAEVKAELTAQVGGEEIKEGDEVKAGEIVTYTATLTNSGKETAEGVTLTATVPENATLMEVNPTYFDNNENVEGVEVTTSDANQGMYLIENSKKEISKTGISIEAGKTVKQTYMLRANTDFGSNNNMETKIVANYENKEVASKSFTNKIVGATLRATVIPVSTASKNNVESGYNYIYKVKVTNLTDKEQKNVIVTLNKSDFIELKNIDYISGETYKSFEGNGDTFTIDSIAANDTAYAEVEVLVKTSSRNSNIAEISATVKDESGNVYRTNKLSEKVTGVEVKTELTTSASVETESGYVHPGDKVKYEIKIKNTGTKDAEKLTIEDQFSDYLSLSNVTLNGTKCEFEKQEEFGEGVNYSTLVVNAPLKVGEEARVNIDAIVNENLSTEEVLKATNKAYAYNDVLVGESEENTLYIQSIKTIESAENVTEGLNNGTNNNNGGNSSDNSNTSSTPSETTLDTDQGTTANSNTNNNTNNNSNNNTNNNLNNNKKTSNTSSVEKYIISGKVWLDKDKNGSRDSGEDMLEGVKVYAIDVSTNNTVAEGVTGSDGSYTIENVAKGKYLVAFEYDTEKYVVTVYQADGVSSEKNSDAVKATKTVNGQNRTLAITDSMNLNKNVSNIDLGLTEAKVFDLSLEKVVSKMVVTNESGTKTTNFDDTDLAKVEIKSKYLSESNVVIEYKIKVKNNGEVDGYVKNVVDYIPSSLKFNSSLNKDWYQKGNYIYNSSLANTKIEPGETKELTLTLTKRMTESNTGLTNNKAEIESAYNTLGIEDKNSTPGNNQEGENDMGSASVLITPGTGAVVSYVALTLSVIIVICGAAYLVNKKILKEKIKI